MRPKLKTFSDFAARLLPHETQYLLKIQQLTDESKLGILMLADRNARHIHEQIPYDPDLDKRKYSNLKSWVEQRLGAVDVDRHFEWMSALHLQDNYIATSIGIQ